ncbi:MAG: hypothetical protein Tsb005_13140 [Gammaproteobacteria bacterium]
MLSNTIITQKELIKLYFPLIDYYINKLFPEKRVSASAVGEINNAEVKNTTSAILLSTKELAQHVIYRQFIASFLYNAHQVFLQDPQNASNMHLAFFVKNQFYRIFKRLNNYLDHENGIHARALIIFMHYHQIIVSDFIVKEKEIVDIAQKLPEIIAYQQKNSYEISRVELIESVVGNNSNYWTAFKRLAIFYNYPDTIPYVLVPIWGLIAYIAGKFFYNHNFEILDIFHLFSPLFFLGFILHVVKNIKFELNFSISFIPSDAKNNAKIAIKQVRDVLMTIEQENAYFTKLLNDYYNIRKGSKFFLLSQIIAEKMFDILKSNSITYSDNEKYEARSVLINILINYARHEDLLSLEQKKWLSEFLATIIKNSTSIHLILVRKIVEYQVGYDWETNKIVKANIIKKQILVYLKKLPAIEYEAYGQTGQKNHELKLLHNALGSRYDPIFSNIKEFLSNQESHLPVILMVNYLFLRLSILGGLGAATNLADILIALLLVSLSFFKNNIQLFFCYNAEFNYNIYNEPFCIEYNFLLNEAKKEQHKNKKNKIDQKCLTIDNEKNITNKNNNKKITFENKKYLLNILNELTEDIEGEWSNSRADDASYEFSLNGIVHKKLAIPSENICASLMSFFSNFSEFNVVVNESTLIIQSVGKIFLPAMVSKKLALKDAFYHESLQRQQAYIRESLLPLINENIVIFNKLSKELEYVFKQSLTDYEKLLEYINAILKRERQDFLDENFNEVDYLKKIANQKEKLENLYDKNQLHINFYEPKEVKETLKILDIFNGYNQEAEKLIKLLPSRFAGNEELVCEIKKIKNLIASVQEYSVKNAETIKSLANEKIVFYERLLKDINAINNKVIEIKPKLAKYKKFFNKESEIKSKKTKKEYMNGEKKDRQKISKKSFFTEKQSQKSSQNNQEYKEKKQKILNSVNLFSNNIAENIILSDEDFHEIFNKINVMNKIKDDVQSSLLEQAYFQFLRFYLIRYFEHLKQYAGIKNNNIPAEVKSIFEAVRDTLMHGLYQVYPAELVVFIKQLNIDFSILITNQQTIRKLDDQLQKTDFYQQHVKAFVNDFSAQSKLFQSRFAKNSVKLYADVFHFCLKTLAEFNALRLANNNIVNKALNNNCLEIDVENEKLFKVASYALFVAMGEVIQQLEKLASYSEAPTKTIGLFADSSVSSNNSERLNARQLKAKMYKTFLELLTFSKEVRRLVGHNKDSKIIANKFSMKLYIDNMNKHINVIENYIEQFNEIYSTIFSSNINNIHELQLDPKN